MRAIKRTDTKPEIELRRALHAQGFRYRKDFRIDLADVKVRPDIVFTARKIAVFVDGCFWHSCPDHGAIPATNTSFWEPKLQRTIERDKSVTVALKQEGWHVLRFWEHDPLDAAVAAIAQAVSGQPGKYGGDTTEQGRQGAP